MIYPRVLRGLLPWLGVLLSGCSQCQAPSEQGTPSQPAGSASPVVPSAIEEPSEEATNAFAKAANAFGLDLYGRLVKDSENLVFSPVSLAVALTMAWTGAGNETRAQMANVLHLPEPAADTHRAASALLREWNAPHGDGLELRAANGLFLDRTVKLVPEFSNAMTRYYHTGMDQLDLRLREPARIRINEWVKTETHQRIRELIPKDSLSPFARLVLINAVYFQGRWERRFAREATAEQPFYLTTGAPTRVATMYQEDVLRYGVLPEAQVIELGYTGGQMTMLIVLPTARDGLRALESGLSGASISRFRASLRRQQVKVFLPRFRIDPVTPLSCKPALISAGMELAFDKRRADFTRMAANELPPLVIADVYHKAFLQVDETGTQAAAASAVILHAPAVVRVPPPIPEFRTDHPFLFLIHDARSGAILFMGRVEDPSRG